MPYSAFGFKENSFTFIEESLSFILLILFKNHDFEKEPFY